MKRLFILILVLLLVAGCSQVDMKSYVASDRATYNAVSGEYLEFLDASKLSKKQKVRRRRLIVTWEKRIKAAEGGK